MCPICTQISQRRPISESSSSMASMGLSITRVTRASAVSERVRRAFSSNFSLFLIWNCRRLCAATTRRALETVANGDIRGSFPYLQSFLPRRVANRHSSTRTSTGSSPHKIALPSPPERRRTKSGAVCADLTHRSCAKDQNKDM